MSPPTAGRPRPGQSMLWVRRLSLMLRVGMWLAATLLMTAGIYAAVALKNSDLLLLALAVTPLILYVTWLHMRIERLEDRFSSLLKDLDIVDDTLASSLLPQHARPRNSHSLLAHEPSREEQSIR